MIQTFWGPSAEVCEQMKTGTYLQPLEILAPALDCAPPDAVAQLVDLFHDTADAQDLFSILETDYVRLFVSDRAGIAAPLYASCYEGETPLP